MTMSQNENVLRIVWGNTADKRYVPMSYTGGSTGWGVWDQREKCWADDKLGSIDPNEMLARLN